jgi:hypothetical protein
MQHKSSSANNIHYNIFCICYAVFTPKKRGSANPFKVNAKACLESNYSQEKPWRNLMNDADYLRVIIGRDSQSAFTPCSAE